MVFPVFSGKSTELSRRKRKKALFLPLALSSPPHRKLLRPLALGTETPPFRREKHPPARRFSVRFFVSLLFLPASMLSKQTEAGKTSDAYHAIQTYQRLPSYRRPTGSHPPTHPRGRKRPCGPNPAGGNRLGKDLHHSQRHPEHRPSYSRAGTQQDPGRPTLLGVQGIFPGERRRILRFVLRLLPARGLHSFDRHLHRERPLDQRRHRKTPPFGRVVAALLAPGRDRGGFRVVPLRDRQPLRV